MSEEKKLDQFYTKTHIAKEYYDILDKKYNLKNFMLVEPSAGTGSFSDNFTGDFIAIDLSPKKDYMIKNSFFCNYTIFIKLQKIIFYHVVFFRA